MDSILKLIANVFAPIAFLLGLKIAKNSGKKEAISELEKTMDARNQTVKEEVQKIEDAQESTSTSKQTLIDVASKGEF